jgi:PAS domain S-box-containing protein
VAQTSERRPDLGRSDLGHAPGQRHARGPSSYEYLKLIEEKGQVGFWTWDFTSGQQHWSLGMCRILGVDPRSFEPTTDLFTSLIHPADREARTERLHDIVQHGIIPEIEYRIIRPDHSLRSILCRGSIRLSRMGRPEGAVGAIFDITALKEATESGQRAASRYRALVTATSSIIWTAAPDGSVVEAAAWRALTGQTCEETRAEGWLACVHPDDRERTLRAWRDATRTGAPFQVLFRVRSARGIYLRFDSRAAAVRNPNGAVQEWLGVLLSVPASEPADSQQSATGAQIRAARALARWSESNLAKAAGVSRSTVQRVEEADDFPAVRPETVRRVRRALEEAGVEFTFEIGARPGVRPREEGK